MKPSEVLAHLVRFVEDPEEVATMTPDEIRRELEAEGVDLDGLHQRLEERLKLTRLKQKEPAVDA